MKREVPSGITPKGAANEYLIKEQYYLRTRIPFPWVIRITEHKLVLLEVQNLHDLHSGMYNGMTSAYY